MITYHERQIRLNLSGDGLIRTGLYNGEEHLIVPTVALLGDIVVFGLHAEFPELVPASELAFSLPSWAGRPVVPDHPPDGSANTPDRLDDFQYGQIFFPEFSDNRLRFEIWLSRSRAENAGTTWVIEELEAGNMVEISIGASIELEVASGTNSAGEYYGGIWRNICGDHIAVGLSGGRGACNLDMGCGALRFMSESEMLEAQGANMSNGKNETRSTRRIVGTAGNQNPLNSSPAVPATPTPTGALAEPAANEPASFLASLTARMSDMWNSMRGLVEDTGQSDWQIRNALADAVYLIEPGSPRVLDVYPDSSTFIYVCFEWYPYKTFYRRTYTKTDTGVSISDTREEVTFSDGWKTVTTSDSTTTTTTTVTAGAATSAPSCGCGRNNNVTNSATPKNGEEEDDMKRDAILKRLAALSDEELERLVETPAPATETPAAPAVPVTPTAPVQAPAAPATPVTPGQPPTTPAVPTDSATLTAAATAILSASGIDVTTLNAVLAGEKARQTQIRETLITALSSRVPNLTREILTPQSTAQLEMMAQAAGIMNQPAALGFSGDYSGLGMPVQPAALESGKKYTPPDPFKLYGDGTDGAN